MITRLASSASLLALAAAAPAFASTEAAERPVGTDDVIVVTTLPIEVASDEEACIRCMLAASSLASSSG